MINKIFITHKESPNKIIIISNTDDWSFDRVLILNYLMVHCDFKFNYFINYKCWCIEQLKIIMERFRQIYFDITENNKLLQVFTKDKFNKDILTKDNIEWTEINKKDIDNINIRVKNYDLYFNEIKDVKFYNLEELFIENQKINNNNTLEDILNEFNKFGILN